MNNNKTHFKKLRDFLKENKSKNLIFMNSGRVWKTRVHLHVIKFYNNDNADDPEIYRYSENNVTNCELVNLCGTQFLKIEITYNKNTEDSNEPIYLTDLYSIYEQQ